LKVPVAFPTFLRTKFCVLGEDGGTVTALSFGVTCGNPDGGTTVTLADPLAPELDAVIVVDPAACAVAVVLPPVEGETVTTAVLFDDQLTVHEVSAAPPAVYGMALNDRVLPGLAVHDVGLTSTRAAAQ
jgi:hypothetical protein